MGVRRGAERQRENRRYDYEAPAAPGVRAQLISVFSPTVHLRGELSGSRRLSATPSLWTAIRPRGHPLAASVPPFTAPWGCGDSAGVVLPPETPALARFLAGPRCDGVPCDRAPHLPIAPGHAFSRRAARASPARSRSCSAAAACTRSTSRSSTSTAACRSPTRRSRAARATRRSSRRASCSAPPTQLGLVAELDRACRSAAIEGALAAGLQPPQALFVNVEPGAVLGDDAPLSHEDALLRGAPARRRRAHRARAHGPPGRGARRRRVAARARVRDRARRRRRRRALARPDALPRARRHQARHVADPGPRRLTGRGARAQRGRRRGRALRRGAARRGDRDRGAPRPGARGRRDAGPGLAVRSPGARCRPARRPTPSTACRCARTSRCRRARRSS